MALDTTLFRTRIPTRRLQTASRILGRLGLKPGDAFNMMLAQIELRKALPLDVTCKPLLATEQQGEEWENAFGEY